MGPDQRDMVHGLRLTVIAVVSAVITATLVIGVGETVLDRPAGPLVQASLN